MNKRMTSWMVAGGLGLAALPMAAESPAIEAMLLPETFSQETTQTLSARYWMYYPKGYGRDENRQWPLMMFLHGAGERGDDLEKVKVHGPPKLVQGGQDFPFLLVAPQCPAGQTWDPDTLMALLDHIQATQRVDPARVYLTGLSMGGYGTWTLGLRHPERFAAIAPICGGGEIIRILLAPRDKMNAMQAMGIWAFHGAKDSVVPLEESERMVDALRNRGCKDVQLTVYPEAGHDSWTESYANPALYEWFLKHARPRQGN